MNEMPGMWGGSQQSVPFTIGDPAGDPAPASVHELLGDLRVGGGRDDAGAGVDATPPDRRLGAFETAGDLVFFADAWKLGYLKDNVHAPGDGRGFWAYYRDFGIVPPEVLERHNKTRQFTGEDFDSARHAVEIDGTTALSNTGRRVPAAIVE